MKKAILPPDPEEMNNIRAEVAGVVYNKLAQLIRLCAAHGIRIEGIMVAAIAACDAEPPFSR